MPLVTTALLGLALMAPASADEPAVAPAPTATQAARPEKDRRRGQLRREIVRNLSFWAVSPPAQRPAAPMPPQARESATTRAYGERGCGL